MSVRAESCRRSIPVRERPAYGGSDRAARRDGSERSRRVERREPRLAHSESPPTFSRDGCCHTDLRARDFCERHVLVSLSKATPRRRGCPQHRPPRWAGTAQCPSSTSRGGWVFDWGGQIWAIPPSTKISLPVMKRLSSEGRKLTPFATSAGTPFRPMGAMLAVWAK